MSMTEAERKRLMAKYLGEPEAPVYKPGEIHGIKTPDGAGRPITRYVGHQGACWDQFNPPVRYVRRLLVPAR